MKSKKVTMLAAALVVAVVAFAAVGYATTQYTAKTTSTNDKAESAYIKVTQSETGAYDGDWLTKVYFDTVNETDASAANTTFELHKDSAVSEGAVVPGNDMALISGALKLTVTAQNSSDTKLKLTVTTTGLNAVAGLSYRMILVTTYTAATEQSAAVISGIVGNIASTNGTWEFTNIPAVAGAATFYALMFVEQSAVSNSDPGASAGFANPATFNFLVEADDA